MLEVAVLNFCYDVPVKLYSTHLFLMSVFLLLPDFKPMWEFFVRRRMAVLKDVWVPRSERRSLRIARRAAFGLICFLCVWVNVLGGYLGRQTLPPHAPLYGTWSVDSVTGWPGTNVPQSMMFDTPLFALVKQSDGGQTRFRVDYGATEPSVRFLFDKGPLLFRWTRPSDDKVELRGEWMGAPVTVNMHRTDPNQYLLTSRGFHWVQEFPFNR